MFRVTLTKVGRSKVRMNYHEGEYLVTGTETVVVDANWIIKEWHVRLGYGVEIERIV